MFLAFTQRTHRPLAHESKPSHRASLFAPPDDGGSFHLVVDISARPPRRTSLAALIPSTLWLAPEIAQLPANFGFGFASPTPHSHRHGNYPSISSTLSLLEERESETEKRAGVYVTDEGEDDMDRPVPRPMGRGRSSSATVAATGPVPLSSSPRRRQRPTLSALSTSASSPQLRRLAELATIPSPSFSVASTLLPSPMSVATVVPEADVAPGEAITVEEPAKARAAEAELAPVSRWSIDSVASRPHISQMALDDASSLPASKSRKRDRFLSLISGRGRSSSFTKPLPPPNTPRGSSDVLDIRRIDSPESSTASSRPSFSMSPMAPSLSSSNSSNGSTISMLATPVDASHDFTDPFAVGSPSCVPDDAVDGSPVFAANPYLQPESPLLLADQPATSPSPPPQMAPEPLTLQIPERALSPDLPPPEPTLPLPSPSTPSPSFLVPSPRPQSFFASITGRQRRRRKKLVISGAPLELTQSRASSSVSAASAQDDLRLRQVEQRRRVQNVVRWCESFGPVRKIETKEDGSLHVYWKDWEVADMVSAAALWVKIDLALTRASV